MNNNRPKDKALKIREKMMKLKIYFRILRTEYLNQRKTNDNDYFFNELTLFE